MPVNEVTTNANEYIYYTPTYTYIPTGEYTFSITYYDEAESAVTCSTAKVQEEEEFDTTEIEKYIDSLEKEVVGTEN